MSIDAPVAKLDRGDTVGFLDARGYPIGRIERLLNWKSALADATNEGTSPLSGCSVAEGCTSKGCKMTVPAALAAEHMCILHFTLNVEQECAEMRREANMGKVPHERQQEFMKKIADRGLALVNAATSGFAMSDEMKARVLSTLLTLMTCRENIDRAAMRQSALRRFVG